MSPEADVPETAILFTGAPCVGSWHEISSDTIDPMSRGGVWYSRTGVLPSGLLAVAGVVSPTHADGTVTSDAPDGPLIWHSEPAESALVRIVVPADAAPAAPALWFVHVDEPKASPIASNLVAFATDHRPPGTVVSKFAFATMGVSNDHQAGAVRWYPDSALVHQIFVAPQWRRRAVGTVLLYVADGFHQANGWPGHLHSDGRRTELGQQFIAGVRHPTRFAPLAQTMPPMDASSSE